VPSFGEALSFYVVLKVSIPAKYFTFCHFENSLKIEGKHYVFFSQGFEILEMHNVLIVF
jgi:hypothetical protein